MVFYAVVCGTLSVAAPKFVTFPIRFGIGATVGVVAAALLPWIKGMMAGGY